MKRRARFLKKELLGSQLLVEKKLAQARVHILQLRDEPLQLVDGSHLLSEKLLLQEVRHLWIVFLGEPVQLVEPIGNTVLEG